ncbi:TetR/AcrR family transcriptional regulator [Rhodococcus ruber]|uniref:TetR/AcrR family transcriptional regulator n=1 Tax=Rhodococcus TaxID=1827 RepID=UPI000F522048|nr:MULTISPECIES: TetR/AcrR family transcriptional regulator [Rhodococcus]MDO1481167.1 TetR/AcrR family transcriptional regulator [Rhodococcus ruber]QRE79296.1 TetR/AcrR family transcriptional regulator [Rhodococcus ruber]RQM33734.1 TetR family transcriptional regulator [Rhodococcus ruber]WKK11252.1 TetR/AcrR family transcriptional regulator [Rhodococcus ruber]WML63072.1 TetR/AcrR family transcriptional regulator [Rhodococcus sp. AH-ZY2]
MTAQPELRRLANWREFEALQLDPILEHALDAFGENGFHGTSVRDLARRVGVTVPALYYHHENKEAVLVALLHTAVRDLTERALAAVAAGGDDPVRRFTHFVEAIVLNSTYRSRQSALDSELRHVSPQNRRHYAATRKRVELIALDLVGEGVERGVFVVDDIAEAVRALLGMCQSIARWYRIGGPLTPDQVAARYTVIALRIVGCPSAAARTG